MAGSSTGGAGLQINVGDYVKIPYSAISGSTVGNQTSYIGVCLTAGGQYIGGQYLTSSGTLVSFANVLASQCQSLGAAGGPANAGYGNLQN